MCRIFIPPSPLIPSNHRPSLSPQFCLFFSFKDFIYLCLERGEGKEKERERNIHARPLPHWGPGPQPKHVSWLGIEPVTLWFAGQHSIHWATSVRAAFSRMSYSWGHMACSLFILASLSRRHFIFLHLSFHGLIAHFVLAVTAIAWHGCIVPQFTHSPPEDVLAAFQVVAVIHNAAITVCAWVFAWTCFQLIWVNSKEDICWITWYDYG